jgi:transposase-like protein
MRISGCRLKEKTQDRLAEFFVGGVTARSAADLARVNRKTGAYFFHRRRQIIARQLEDSLPVEGLVEVDESYFGGVRKGKRGRGAAGKIPVFGILKRGGKVHTVMISTSAKTHSCPSSGRRLFRIRLSIPTLIPPMTSSTSPSSTTTGSTTQTPMFSIATTTSTESRTSGTRPSARPADTTAFRKPTFRSFSRRPNFASTTENQASNCEPSNAGPNSSLSQPIWDSPKAYYEFEGDGPHCQRHKCLEHAPGR